MKRTIHETNDRARETNVRRYISLTFKINARVGLLSGIKYILQKELRSGRLHPTYELTSLSWIHLIDKRKQPVRYTLLDIHPLVTVL